MNDKTKIDGHDAAGACLSRDGAARERRREDAAGADREHRVRLLDETRCQALETFLADRLYEFNSRATGYFDGRLLGGRIDNAAGETIAGVSGHTWGGCCAISNLWVDERHRGRGLGKALLCAAETEALGQGCAQVVIITHSFQAPGFYERLGYTKYAIHDLPTGHADIVFTKALQQRPDAEPMSV
jgi:ribosomal protein S18 acetylase RimI-like enzyme